VPQLRGLERTEESNDFAKKNRMPEIAKKILEFIADREDDLGRLSNFEILICRIDGDIYVDEGLPYLLSKRLVDIPDPNELTYRITPAGRSALHAVHILQAVRDLA
jgi:hypothetical protein